MPELTVAAIPALAAWLTPRLRAVLLPSLAQLFGLSISRLRVGQVRACVRATSLAHA